MLYKINCLWLLLFGLLPLKKLSFLVKKKLSNDFRTKGLNLNHISLLFCFVVDIRSVPR